ncbi:hypothetical protein ACFE04_022743 [Oxalis oulophora]
MGNRTTTLKLLVDTKNQKVIFAEANKDFVDFLFSIIHVPAGALNSFIVLNNLSNGHCTIACMNNLHTSLLNLNLDYKSKTVAYNNKPITACVNNNTSLFLLQYIATSPKSESESKYLLTCSSKGCNLKLLLSKAMKLLKAMLQSKTVLTDLFLGDGDKSSHELNKFSTIYNDRVAPTLYNEHYHFSLDLSQAQIKHPADYTAKPIGAKREVCQKQKQT